MRVIPKKTTTMPPVLVERQAATDDRGNDIKNAACGFLAAAVFIASLRLGLRVRRRLLSWDDAAISVSIVRVSPNLFVMCFPLIDMFRSSRFSKQLVQS